LELAAGQGGPATSRSKMRQNKNSFHKFLFCLIICWVDGLSQAHINDKIKFMK
jgi:hypothetical protein